MALAAAAIFLGGSPAPHGYAEQPVPEPDPLVERGWTVTSGAAPGYVDDALCGRCHADLFESYQEVGMARSFYRPRPETDVEDFEGGFFHEASKRHYEMRRDGGRLVMRRYQLDAGGEPVNVFEQPVDWILGSGSHARTYLYRTPGGEFYQLPIAWYSQSASWGMAPGFDRPDHEGVTRRVRRECMFCHNAYPDVPAGSDAYGAPPVYPEELPEGTGCQRCHGPGAEHARAGMRVPVDFERLSASITNPGRLAPRLRDDVCYGCHLQPSVALSGVRRFGRDDYSFRPGEPLAGYQVGIDVDEEGEERGERFEINHHPYRLEQSRCFRESPAGELSCLTCHDPHRKVPAERRAAHYRAACLGCHTLDACALETMTEESAAAADCAGCHMSPRRTQDVVRVVMTDHLIRRRPGGEELLAPLEESDPVLVGVELTDGERGPQGALGEVYRAAAVVRAGGGANALDYLEKMLAAARPPQLDPWLDLARGRMKRQDIPGAERALAAVLRKDPSQARAWTWLGIAADSRGDRQRALASTRRALERRADSPEAHYNLGLLLLSYGEPAAAVEPLERALEARPNMASAWFQLGRARAAMERFDEAVGGYRRALAIDPGHGDAYLELGRAFLRAGDRDAALRAWRHGAAAALRPGPIVEALAAVE